MRWTAGFLVLWAVPVVTAESGAQCVSPEDGFLIGSDTANLQYFGESVALCGNLAVVGMGKSAPTRVEAAYVFRHDGTQWNQEEKLLSPRPSSACTFGDAVAVDGNVIVVGDWGYEFGGFCQGEGAAHVFRYDGTSWNPEADLIGVNTIASGWSVAVRGNHILVGAPGQNFPAFACPVVTYYRYSGSSWIREQTFEGSDTQRPDFFGDSVALNGDATVAVVGSPSADPGGIQDAGEAYVFNLVGGQWVEVQKLTASDGSPFDFFGRSVSIDGNLIAVGANGDDTSVPNAGSVYVFRHDGTSWVEEQNIGAGDATNGAAFGWSVSLHQSQLAVGARRAGPGGDPGAVYAYRNVNDRWVPVQKMVPTTTTSNDLVGDTVALDGNRCLVGAPQASFVAGGSGVAYYFDVATLRLDTSATQVQPGDPLTLTTCGGSPFGLVLLALTAWNGNPLFLRLVTTTFNAEGLHSLGATVPPGLSGNTGQFQSFGAYRPATFAASNPVTITFQ